MVFLRTERERNRVRHAFSHYMAPALVERLGTRPWAARVRQELRAAGPGRIAFHAGYGIYDGRIFQSIFSQGGANVRFNPPKAEDPFTALIPDSSDFTPYTAIFNVTGQPAITQPTVPHMRTRLNCCSSLIPSG